MRIWPSELSDDLAFSHFSRFAPVDLHSLLISCCGPGARVLSPRRLERWFFPRQFISPGRNLNQLCPHQCHPRPVVESVCLGSRTCSAVGCSRGCHGEGAWARQVSTAGSGVQAASRLRERRGRDTASATASSHCIHEFACRGLGLSKCKSQMGGALERTLFFLEPHSVHSYCAFLILNPRKLQTEDRDLPWEGCVAP